MTDTPRFQEVRFKNFKAFKSFAVAIKEMNVLVGPNNSGKSTVLAAFRILSEGMRRASSRSPELCPGPDGKAHGWPVSLANIPVAGENVFHNYDDSEPAIVTFKMRGNLSLVLYFPKAGVCYMHADGALVRKPADFKKVFSCRVAHVPILGPVEHHEMLYEQEAARDALLNHKASRNFRNIWWHFQEDFEVFRDLVKRTWPGMDVKKPEITKEQGGKAKLSMFACEDRIDREIYWSGFGFQVWCQMLTYVVAARDSSILVIDEPDIYLHSDLQRQLVGILREMPCDVILATHSTELISEVEVGEIVLVNKGSVRGKRVQKVGEIPGVFRLLGSNARYVLTQLGKTRRALFVEGGDFEVFAGFARILGKSNVANRSGFAVIPTGGCRPSGVRDMVSGIEATLGEKIVSMAIFDRDYRCAEECADMLRDLGKICRFSVVHKRKELENFLLVDAAIDAAVRARLRNRSERTGEACAEYPGAGQVLGSCLAGMKIDAMAQCIAAGQHYFKGKDPSKDASTIAGSVMKAFEGAWEDAEKRRMLVSGKVLIADLNKSLEAQYGVSISAPSIIASFVRSCVPSEVVELIDLIEQFAQAKP